MKIDLLVNSDGNVTFAIEGALEGEIVSVEYYKETRLVVFSYNLNDHPGILAEMEVPANLAHHLSHASKALIVHLKGKKILGGFDVPVIQVG